MLLKTQFPARSLAR